MRGHNQISCRGTDVNVPGIDITDMRNRYPWTTQHDEVIYLCCHLLHRVVAGQCAIGV
jgi:hypothetical protein